MKTYLTIMFKVLLTLTLVGEAVFVLAILTHSTRELVSNPGFLLVAGGTIVAMFGAWGCFQLLHPRRPDITRPAPRMTVRRRGGA